MNRQSWMLAQDEAIKNIVQLTGCDDWTKISQQLKSHYNLNRTGKQCRQRWYNHLDPKVTKNAWMNSEEKFLFQQHKEIGNRWKQISKNLPGRTDNDVKNHFYSTLRRSLRRLNKSMGEKNSTSQMRQIKPSVLSAIMKIVYNEESNSTFKKQSQYTQLKDLPLMIFQYSNQKPTKGTNFNSQIKAKYIEILDLINKFNSEYKLGKKEGKKKTIIPKRSPGRKCSNKSSSSTISGPHVNENNVSENQNENQLFSLSIEGISSVEEEISDQFAKNHNQKQEESVIETFMSNQFSPASQMRAAYLFGSRNLDDERIQRINPIYPQSQIFSDGNFFNQDDLVVLGRGYQNISSIVSSSNLLGENKETIEKVINVSENACTEKILQLDEFVNEVLEWN